MSQTKEERMKLRKKADQAVHAFAQLTQEKYTARKDGHKMEIEDLYHLMSMSNVILNEVMCELRYRNDQMDALAGIYTAAQSVN